MKGMKNSILPLALGTATAALCAVALDESLKVVNYKVETTKVKDRIRAAVISDLHSTRYGRHSQSGLIDPLLKLKPDLILLPGDIVDERKSPADAFTLLKQINRIAPCFYVTGNHEFYEDRGEEIKELIRELSIDVLEGDTLYFTKDENVITVSGIDDPYGTEGEWSKQVERVKCMLDDDFFSILISHRPDLYKYYEDIGADLTVAGHAHGGQIVIPGILNGLYAPHQGLFPTHAGGRYKLKSGEMIVSRGLMRDIKPRVFNRPELLVIDIVPKNKK